MMSESSRIIKVVMLGALADKQEKWEPAANNPLTGYWKV
jgi:hypothetical protein